YGTRELNLDVTTNFYTDIDDAHFAHSVIVVENGFSVTGRNWGQSKYYSGGSQGTMGGFENLPQVVPASDIVYDRVGRAIIGGYYGEEGSIPSAVSDGDSPSYSFTYTFPDEIDAENAYLVALLLDTESGAIVNAA